MNTELQNYNRLKNNLESLKLTAMEQNLDSYLDNTEKGGMSPLQALLRLTEAEMKLKSERAVQGCVKVANFPFLKTMEDFDFSFQPDLNKEEILGFKKSEIHGEGRKHHFPGVARSRKDSSVSVYRNRISEKQTLIILHKLCRIDRKAEESQSGKQSGKAAEIL